MIDGGLRKLFHSKLRGFHWQTIESGLTGRGVPDSNFCGNGIEGWVEFKKTAVWAVGLRPEQIGWHLKRARAGGRTFIAVRRIHEGGPRKGPPVDQLWIFPGRMAEELATTGIAEEHRNIPSVFMDDIKRINWVKVQSYLMATKNPEPKTPGQ